MKYIFVFFTFFTTLSGGYSQVITDIKPDTTTLKEFEQRIKLTRIDGKYIPKDLNDAMMELNKIMEDGAKKNLPKCQKMMPDKRRISHSVNISTHAGTSRKEAG